MKRPPPLPTAGPRADANSGAGPDTPSVGAAWLEVPETERQASFRRLGESLASGLPAAEVAPHIVNTLVEMGDARFAALWRTTPASTDDAPLLLAAAGERPTGPAPTPPMARATLRSREQEIGLLEWWPTSETSRAATACLAPWIAREVAALEAPEARLRGRLQHAGLTPRQREIALLLREGHTNKQLAARFDCAVSTIEEHLGSVYHKLGVRRRAQVVAWLATAASAAAPDPVGIRRRERPSPVGARHPPREGQ